MVMISFHANGKAPCEEELLTIPFLEETDQWWQIRGLPWWLSGKESTCQGRRCRRHGFYPWVRKFPWRSKWQSALIFLLENSKDRGAWQATVHGAEKSHTWLSICMWTIDQKLIAKGQKNSRSRSHSNRRRILDTEVQRCESCLRLQSREVVEPRGPEILVPPPARPFLLLCPSPGIPSASPNLWTFTLHQNSAQTIPPLSCPLLLGCIHLDFSPPGRSENSATLTSSSHLSLRPSSSNPGWRICRKQHDLVCSPTACVLSAPLGNTLSVGFDNCLY